jgi:hypothetical protein
MNNFLLKTPENLNLKLPQKRMKRLDNTDKTTQSKDSMETEP